MDIVIRIIGIAIVVMSIAYLFKPAVLRGVMKFFKGGGRIYFTGILRFALAVIFLLGARECRITWLITTFGILFILSGMLVFTLGPKKIRAILEWYLAQSDTILRVLAIFVFAVGSVIVYAA